MSSPQRSYNIPESLKVKKSPNIVKRSASMRMSQMSSPYRRTLRRYDDLDNPHGGMKRDDHGLSFPKRSSGVTYGRQSVARAARVARRVSSTQLLSPCTSSRNPRPSSETAKRLSASRLGTVFSGVDNRFSLFQEKSPSSVSKVRHLTGLKKANSLFKKASPLFAELKFEGDKNEPMTRNKNESPNRNEKFSADGRAALSKLQAAHQLRRLLGRVCPTDYDKYQILDERDKILHRARVKTTDVENAEVTQGTCPDMCPEKERYVRIVQNRLHAFECDENGQLIPELAVKEYSRSAADQEESLPHELRPSDVLLRTMNYLVGKVANDIPRTDDELGQWYDFLWNRTRAIRKDITQQMLVNETAVVLIEECVRLHIYAAHRLCSLDVSEFDQKMNTENLTKCLQSVRYLYEDLAKKNIYMTNEPEFRAYDILLNLEDSNVFRQALTYRREIFDSEPVRFALHLFTCLQNNNYVRFFRLLREKATYLQCCLCHRYFNRVRQHAVRAMSYAVHISGKFPVQKCVQLLGFDGVDDAVQFLDSYGVRRDNDLDTGEESIYISRVNILEPFGNPTQRMHAWIEAKRNERSLTQVLNGGYFVAVDVPTPLNSFDGCGVYSDDLVINSFIDEAENEQTSADDVEKGKEPCITEATSRESKARYEQFIVATIVKDMTQELYSNILDDCVQLHSQETLMACKLMYRRKLAADAVEQQRVEIRALSRILCSVLLDSVIGSLGRTIAQKTLREYLKTHETKLLDKTAVNVYTNLLGEVIDELINSAADEEINANTAYIEKRLKEIRTNIDRLWLKQFFDAWRECIAKRKEKERTKVELLKSFPLMLNARNGLRIPRRPECPFSLFPVDYSNLLFEQKLNVFTTKRHERIARKALQIWRSWALYKKEKRMFFESLCATPQRMVESQKQGIPYEDMQRRLDRALFEVRMEKQKRYRSNVISCLQEEEEEETSKLEELEELEEPDDWMTSLQKRSSSLLDYMDKDALGAGLKMAHEGLTRAAGSSSLLKWEDNDVKDPYSTKAGLNNKTLNRIDFILEQKKNLELVDLSQNIASLDTDTLLGNIEKKNHFHWKASSSVDSDSHCKRKRRSSSDYICRDQKHLSSVMSNEIFFDYSNELSPELKRLCLDDLARQIENINKQLDETLSDYQESSRLCDQFLHYKNVN